MAVQSVRLSPSSRLVFGVAAAVCDVVEGNIFPTTAGAKPMQVIYTVAKLFAEQLPPVRP